MKKILCFLLLAVFSSSASAIEVYSWLDEKGVAHYTDDYGKVPAEYGNRVQVKKMEEIGKPEASVSPHGLLQERKETRMDIYGRGEAWWREEVRSWQEKLKEATENYGNANEKFLEKAGAVSRTNFYGRSRSQTKWDMMALNRLNTERKNFEAKVIEAKGALEKLFKEAEESKANPDWLK